MYQLQLDNFVPALTVVTVGFIYVLNTQYAMCLIMYRKVINQILEVYDFNIFIFWPAHLTNLQYNNHL